MEKYLIGYKQGNGEYVYVESINSYKIGVTLDINNALEFADEIMAKNICEYLDYKNKDIKYRALKVIVNIEEVTE